MAQDNEKELLQLKNRFHDLADRSYTQGVFTFTGFLGLGEQDIFWQEEGKLRYAGYQMNGGCERADRVVLRFGSEQELGYEVPFPIVCIHIKPLQQKFADDLSHRDFLGALMNLGIERSTIGDIKVGEKQAYLFCLDSIAEYICDNLTQVRHTHVSCQVTESLEEFPEEEPEYLTIQVQSMRVDAVISKVYNLSREKSLVLFKSGKVYVNGRLCENNSRLLKQGEVVNARGFGKFTLSGDCRETRKGKLAVVVGVYR
ncbi:MAG: YlmH/Sll1252 family protein [Acetatifactor sp.]|nr:YlmH/Sll1252 family protein [Acetatifactor sp.]